MYWYIASYANGLRKSRSFINHPLCHMSVMASETTNNSAFCLTACSVYQQRKHQSWDIIGPVWGHRSPVDSSLQRTGNVVVSSGQNDYQKIGNSRQNGSKLQPLGKHFRQQNVSDDIGHVDKSNIQSTAVITSSKITWYCTLSSIWLHIIYCNIMWCDLMWCDVMWFDVM